jgi:thiamine biosynthesis lipoprotein
MAPTCTPSQAAASWPAMGTRAQVQLVGADDAALFEVRALMYDCERRWSRFLPDSEVSVLNAANGRPVVLSADTAELLHEAAAWWRATDGHFDPTVLAAVRDAGYVRSFAQGPGPIGEGAPVPGCAGLRIDLCTGMAQAPPGVGFDLGGIGKGAAVDRAIELVAPLSRGALVELGGDLRVWGDPPSGSGWPIGVEDVRTGEAAALLWLASGAVATSTTLRRRWVDGGRSAHHLIDPATGRPSEGDLVAVTVVAARATGAEVLAKAALVAGAVAPARSLLERHGVAGLLFPEHGEPTEVGGFRNLCHPGRCGDGT